MGNPIWFLLETYCCLQQWKNFANRPRIDKVIAMVRVAPFFDSRCRFGWAPITLGSGPHSNCPHSSSLNWGLWSAGGTSISRGGRVPLRAPMAIRPCCMTLQQRPSAKLCGVVQGTLSEGATYIRLGGHHVAIDHILVSPLSPLLLNPKSIKFFQAVITQEIRFRSYPCLAS